MSCLMYQPYASYFPYQRPSASASSYQDSIKKFHASLDKVPDGLHNHHCAPYPSALSLGHHSHSVAHAPSGLLHPSSSLGAAPPTASILPKEEQPTNGHGCTQDKSHESLQQPKDTQYLSANCVLFSYFNGDIATSVDEHFTRSLSQSGSQTSGGSPGATCGGDSQVSKSSSWKSSTPPIPMSQRNFPPSFWNSNYQPPSTFSNFTDPYMSSLHSMSSLAQDPWRYSFSSQPHSYTHPSLHDFSYGSMASATNRFNTQFSSLMPSAGKLGTLGQYELAKHTADAWPSSRYHGDPFGASTSLQASQDPYGLYTGALSGAC